MEKSQKDDSIGEIERQEIKSQFEITTTQLHVSLLFMHCIVFIYFFYIKCSLLTL